MRDSKCDVLLVGYEGQENLGMRSIAAYLEREQIRVGIEPLPASSREQVLARILRDNPKLVGFSLIFQRMLPDFAGLIAHLRDHGVTAHFTAGGHFPSFEPAAILDTIPGLDSVVRHEGEETALDLYRALDRPESWAQIKGLAYRSHGRVELTPPRPLIADLDTLPYPVRRASPATHRGLGVCSLAASRGCYYNCSFCSIQQFYQDAPGPKRRARSAANVVGEMEALYQRGIRIFVFQDDDLYMRGPYCRWVEELLRELHARSLADRVLWRISCRIDDLVPDLLIKMKAAGLGSVYLGIESGADQGLRTFNKHYGVADVRRAVQLLRGLDLPFEFGFMICDPDSTMTSIRENIEFLKWIGREGDCLVNFCKMAAYAGTPIAARLRNEQRLHGTLGSPDYDFLDPRLSWFQLFLSQTFNFRNFDERGLVERLRFAKFDSAVLARFFGDHYNADAYAKEVKELIRRCNESAVTTLSLAANFIAALTEDQILDRWPLLERWAQSELREESQIAAELDAVMDRYAFQGEYVRSLPTTVLCES
jgi:anaerobic magnesium-protoporphyrin IX monomethyl ester cyclase